MRVSFRSVRLIPLGVIAGVLALLTILPSTAAAQGSGVGVRGGLSVDDIADQFYFGLHYETPELADRLTFRPNVEVGLGDDWTISTFNFEVAYYLPLQNTRNFDVYVGGGPALVNFRPDSELGLSSETEPGFNLLGGLLFDNGFFAEAKIGAIDSPTFKVGVGYSWR
jgi:hypothetical protein